MKRLVIEAEVPDNVAAALQYGNGRLDAWVEDSLCACLESDCGEEPWGKDVERLFGLRYTDARTAFHVTEARIEETGEPDKAPVVFDLDAEDAARLEELARAEGVTPEEMIARLLMREVQRVCG